MIMDSLKFWLKLIKIPGTEDERRLILLRI